MYSKLRTWALQALQQQGKALTGDIGVGASIMVAFLAGCGNVLATCPIWVVSTQHAGELVHSSPPPPCQG